MPQHAELQWQDSHRQVSPAEDWFLIENSPEGSVPQKILPSAPEINTSDMAGLLASMKLQCAELAEAQGRIERVLQAQTDQIESRPSQLTTVKDEFARSLDEHTLDMQKRLTEKIHADVEALATVLRQELTDDIRRLQDEMDWIVQMLAKETKQRERGLQALEANMEHAQASQQAAFDSVNERAMRLEERIRALENIGREDVTMEESKRQSTAGSTNDEAQSRARVARGVDDVVEML